jgi:hypothetical protein
MVQTKGHNASMLTPVGRLYKQERTVKKMLVVEPDYLPDSEVFVFSLVYTP